MVYETLKRVQGDSMAMIQRSHLFILTNKVRQINSGWTLVQRALNNVHLYVGSGKHQPEAGKYIVYHKFIGLRPMLVGYITLVPQGYKFRFFHLARRAGYVVKRQIYPPEGVCYSMTK